MRRIIILLLVLAAIFVFIGCASAPGGKQTGGLAPLVSTNTKRAVAQPVVAKLPAGERISKQKTVKRVFLTFDDGPDAATTPAVLDILDRYGVKATFFVIGTCVEKNPGILKEIVRRGHAVGNHTYNHKYRDLYSVKGGFLKSVKINGEVIYRTIGMRPYIVRDPGGKIRNNMPVRKIMAENKYKLVEWNVDSYDSRKPYMSAPKIIDNVRLQISNPRLWSDMVILLHDGKGHINTVNALPAIIEMLKKDGFTFEVVR